MYDSKNEQKDFWNKIGHEKSEMPLKFSRDNFLYYEKIYYMDQFKTCTSKVMISKTKF